METEPATRTSPKAILFDLDGVIVDSEAVHHRAYELALQPFGVTGIPFETYAEHWSNRGRGLDYVARHYPGVDPTDLKRRKEAALLDLLRNDARLRPGAAIAVQRLAARWPLALATGSARAVAALVLDRFALREQFRVVVAREDYRLDKPAPDAFLKAAELVGVPPGECVVIEDSVKGLTAARAARMCCILVPNDYTRRGDFRDAQVVLDSMDELTAELVEGCEQRIR